MDLFLRVFICVTVAICLCILPAEGQVDTGATLTEIGADTTLIKPKKMRKVMEDLGERAKGRNIQKFAETRNAIRQSDIIDQIKRITLQASDFVKTSIDTAAIWKDYYNTDSLFQLAGEGIFTNTEEIQTHRNLTISYKIISVLLAKSIQRKEQVDNYRKQLADYKYRLDSLSADSTLYQFPADSATFAEYLNTLFLAVADVAPADSAIMKSIENVHGLQIQLTLQVNRFSKALEQIDAARAALSSNISQREYVNIWTPIPYLRPLPEIIYFSKQKNQLALNYYAERNKGKIIFTVLMIFSLSIFLRSLKRKLKEENELKKDFTGQLVFRHPVHSAIFIGLNLLQFLFKDPPFVFAMIFWIISAFCLTIVFRGYITRLWTVFWLTMTSLFLLSCATNLILQASRQERWWMLLLAIVGIIVGIYSLLKGKRSQLREKGIIYFTGFVILLELFAVFFNVIGRYNLSKTLLTSGFINVIIGIEFLRTARLVHEMIFVASKYYGESEKKVSLIDIERRRSGLPPVYYVVVLTGWFILFARNFYAFRLLTTPLERMLVEEHTIANYSFTLSNVLVFIVIIAISTLLAQVISFFTAPKPGTIPDKNSTKSKMGSWILLVRIAIISGGLFLAAAAAGIPMDRITLLLGALGVGIGFGLQELTSSLISGIIIAFEKPVNVGDFVEVDAQSGIMKSIGFRSSVITSEDGANVIIPNATLLSSNLINWTMSNEKRRVDVDVQMMFGTDLTKIKTILLELLASDARILKQPAPAVELVEFKKDTVSIRVYFWVAKVLEWESVRSDLIMEIDRLFREHAFPMPLTQG